MRLYPIAGLAFAFAFASAATALALPQKRAQPPQQFTLLMTVGAGASRTNLSLTAVQNGTTPPDVLLLVGDDPAICAGTPAYLNASLSNFEGSGGEFVALQLDVEGESYGVGVPPIGGMHGVAYSVAADKGYSEFQFEVVDGQVFHKLSSGASEFLVCNKTINGEVKPVLSWGSAPYAEGCSPSSVYQGCNVEGDSIICD